MDKKDVDPKVNTTSEPFVDDAIVSASSSPDVKPYDTGADFTKDIGVLEKKGPRALQKTSWASGNNSELLELEDGREGAKFDQFKNK